MNTAPATAPDEPFQVFLWLECISPFRDGFSAAEFSIATSYFNAGFTPLSGALNAGDSVDLLVVVGGCPRGPIVLGMWTFQDLTGLGGGACMVNSPGGTNGVADCTISPQIHPNAVVGFTTDGSMPCVVGSCDGPVSVEDASWGSIKGLYR